MVRSFEVFAVFFLEVTVLVPGRAAPISCKNDYGVDVPWFFMYKLPSGTINQQSGTVFHGTEYLYVDPATVIPERHWMLSAKNIHDQESALHRTIFPLTVLKDYPDLQYVFYNDQVDRDEHQGHGHTKGVFMFDKKRVVWLIHSVPNFPNITGKNKYLYPESGEQNGQVVYCATFSITHVETIAAHIRYQYPYIYGLKPQKEEIQRHLQDYFKKETSPSNAGVWISTLKDVAQIAYTSFAKPSNHHDDLYSGAVAPHMNSHLLVYTWRNGAGTKVPVHINDSRIVANIEMLTFDLGSQGSVVVKNTADHSKWAIPILRKRNRFVCVGSLNRMFPQYTRGGEVVCFHNEDLYMLLCTSLASLQECSSKRLRWRGV